MAQGHTAASLCCRAAVLKEPLHGHPSFCSRPFYNIQVEYHTSIIMSTLQHKIEASGGLGGAGRLPVKGVCGKGFRQQTETGNKKDLF